MPEFPTGVVTLVFTDIEGSSALWEAHDAAFSPVLEAHNRLMRAAATKFEGREVKTEGDAFFLAFASASDAVRFAVDAQLSLAGFDWNSALPGLGELRVRIGMHTGEPILTAHPDGTADYFGPVVNRAARVGGAGYGGQILVSDATKTLAESVEHGFEDLGKHRLKGVGEETLWQVTHPELPSRFPALKTLAGARHNLPPSQTPFIGREAEVAEWSAILRDSGTRLLTLCGFGGQGKTRLALQIAENLVENFADGVWWVELETARDADAMITRIAHELRLHLQPQPTVREQLFDFHREREILLVLDNTEQLPDAGSVVNGLLAAAPRLKCLVTTRRALEIRAERVVAVPPLPLAQGVALFAERAQSRVADFSLAGDNQSAIEELCLALEGVPLAIELAASRLSVLAPREILDRLDERFRVLQTRAPDLPPRQRALRGAIDWSYELLADEEKSLLAALSVFAGGFSLDAAEVVSDDFDALEGVAQLQRHSFLRSEEQGGQKRFSMLESVRAYAAEKFEDAPDGDEVRGRHAAYFLKFAEKCAQKLRTRDEATTLDKFWHERSNIAAALEWASEQNQAKQAAQLALALYEPLYRLGMWDEARATLEKGNVALGDAPTEAALHGGLQLRLASLAHDAGDMAQAESGAQQALEMARQAGDESGETGALNLLGLLAIDGGNTAAARQFFEASLLKRKAKDENGHAVALHNLALLASRVGQIKEAQDLYATALQHRRNAGDARGEAETLGNLGVLAHNAGNFEAARQLYGQSLELRRTLRDRMGIALMLHNLGEIAVEATDYLRASTFFVHSQRIFQEMGSVYVSASAGALDDLKARTGPDYEELLERADAAAWEDFLKEK